MKRTGNNFDKSVQMHLACSTDKLRPAMANIYFKDGFAYATDTHVLVKNKVSEIAMLREEEIALLDGKLIHADTFKQILKYDYIEIKEDGVECSKNGAKVFFQFSKLEGRYPDVEGVLKSVVGGKHKATGRIGIDLNLIEKLNKALFLNNGRCAFTFNGENDPILAMPSDGKASSIGVVMPLLIEEI